MRRRTALVLAVALFALLACVATAGAAIPPYDNSECLTCHEVTQQAPTSRVAFATPSVNYDKCAACHATMRPYDTHYHYRGACEGCHNGGDYFWIPLPADWPGVWGYPASTPYGYFKTAASLNTAPADLHSIHRGFNWVERELSAGYPQCSTCHASAACTACHDAPAQHAGHASVAYPGPTLKQANGGVAVLAPVTCVNDACHSLAKSGTSAFVPTCASCHPSNAGTHGYSATQHAADVASVVDGGGKTCGDCHETELLVEHQRSSSSASSAQCSACHPGPRGSFGPWNKTCAQGSCHAPGTSTQAHGGAATGHTPPSAGEASACGQCHPGDLAAIHVDAALTGDASKTSCLVCHSTTAVPSTSDCVSCHFVFADHPEGAHTAATSSTCAGAGCHDVADAAANHSGCAVCHDNPTRIAVLPATADCANCHPTEAKPHYASHWATPLLLDGSGPHYAYATGSAPGGAFTDECAMCHVSSLMDEHLGSTGPGGDVRAPRYDDRGDALSCATCHGSLDARVSSAIANGDTSCDACHVVHRQIPATHQSSYIADPAVPCAPCHGVQLEVIHDAGYTTTTPSGKVLTSCAVCHANFEAPRGPVVQAAITAHDTTCSACHSAAHPDAGGHRASGAASLGCGQCHASGGASIDVRSVHSGAAKGACAVCHANAGRVPSVTAATAECASCHSAEGGDYHRGLPGKHTYSAMPATCSSANCHPSNALPVVHEDYVSRDPIYSSTCELCHRNAVPDRIPAAATAACSSCHVVHLNPNHVAGDSQLCVDCHEEADALAIHARVAGGPCDVCHANPTRVPALPATTDCVNCHGQEAPTDPNHYDAAAHAAVDGSEYGYSCSACHRLGMQPEHRKPSSGSVTCVECHEGRVDGLSASWGASCGACHAERHTQTGARHVSTTGVCAGSNCHAIGDVASLHANATTVVAGQTLGGCRVCHQGSDAVPVSTTCTDCHQTHGDLTARHAAPSSSACVACHETTDVRAVHASAAKGECAVCHDNPARVPTLPATAECVNCHAAVSPADPNHYRAVTHTVADSSLPAGVACSQCHFLGMQAEHSKASSGAVSCVTCHESKVDTLAAGWDRSCSTCHAAKHGAMAQSHASTKAACGGTGCHAVTDVSTIHAALSGGGCATCHAGPSVLPATTDCGSAGCHAGITGDHEAQHDTAGVIDAGCTGCHFSSLTAEHKALGYSCAACHASVDPSVTAAIATHDRGCDACHPAVNGRDFHQPQGTSEFIAGNSAMHRVSSSLPGARTSFKVNGTTYSWTLPATASYLKAGWASDSVVTCDKCHAYTGSTGPHGATMKVNMDASYPGDYSTAYLSNSGVSPTNLICAKCHTNFSNMNKVHGESDHNGSSDGKCVLCHSQVPHGWRLPRLLAYTSDESRYASKGLTGISLVNHTPTGWSEGDCSTSCGEHSSSMSNRWPSTVVTVGTVEVRVTDENAAPVAGATVTTSEGAVGTTDALGKAVFAGVTTGLRTVTVSKSGYTTASGSVTVVNGQTVVVPVKLVAIRQGSVSGTVTDSTIGSKLVGATVQVAGGAAAVTGSNGGYYLTLDPGSYTVTYGMTGYTSQTKVLTVISGGSVTQDISLVPAPANLALNKTATSSGDYSSSYSASKAVDGSTSTYWRSSSTGNQWLRVDLGSTQSVSKVIVNWNGYYYARSYRIETSTDGSTWTSRYSTSSGSSGTKTHTFSAVNARYIRLYCTSASSSSYRVNEFEAWAN